MPDTPQAHPDEPILPGAASADEARVFHNIVRKVIGKLGSLPEGVQRVDFRFGEDSEGAPAVWIVLQARSDLNPSREKIAEMLRVANEVRSEVFLSGTERWPYVEIATE